MFQPAPKYYTKGCSHSSVDSPGARRLVFVAFEPFHRCEFRASIALCNTLALYQCFMPKSSESEILAKFFADMGEKFGEKMAKLFADFRPSISRKSGRKKFHEKLATNSAGREKKKVFHRETLGAWGRKMFCLARLFLNNCLKRCLGAYYWPASVRPIFTVRFWNFFSKSALHQEEEALFASYSYQVLGQRGQRQTIDPGNLCAPYFLL